MYKKYQCSKPVYTAEESWIICNVTKKYFGKLFLFRYVIRCVTVFNFFYVIASRYTIFSLRYLSVANPYCLRKIEFWMHTSELFDVDDKSAFSQAAAWVLQGFIFIFKSCDCSIIYINGQRWLINITNLICSKFPKSIYF
jgi:hypothetical protein